ncbi:MAG: hypothetical protein JNK75_06135, partial [Betaproteobacteria bacterium]|nr:hypothetical protein [Betaproteobacteria bacterium]
AMFVALKVARSGALGVLIALLFIVASVWLVRRVHRTLGKPDMDWR